MSDDQPLVPLERGQLGVMLVRGAIFAAILLAAAAIPAFATSDETGISPSNTDRTGAMEA